jgi:hypothetical protein
MEIISKEEIASVALATSRMSEDEIAVYEKAISYALDSLDDDSIAQRFGASRDELEGTRDDLREALAALCESSLEPEPVS